MPQFRARSAGLQPGISPNADLKVGATSAVAPETEALLADNGDRSAL
jgi:hypothetical protein